MARSVLKQPGRKRNRSHGSGSRFLGGVLCCVRIGGDLTYAVLLQFAPARGPAHTSLPRSWSTATLGHAVVSTEWHY